MQQGRNDLDILFRQTLPEAILEGIRYNTKIGSSDSVSVDANAYTYTAYEHYSALNLAKYSIDEIQMRFEALKTSGKCEKEINVFAVLYAYAGQVLKLNSVNPVCSVDELLNWNRMSLFLGQDIFTCSWMAEMDWKNYGRSMGRKKFDWPAVIKTDDRQLNELFQRGLAENHFHLHGSTQSFALSWANMMNHPEYVNAFFVRNKHLYENLNVNVSRGEKDNTLGWNQRILYAGMIRALLFMRCLEVINSKNLIKEFLSFDSLPLPSKVKKYTEILRLQYGTSFQQPDGKEKCLDYAICQEMYDVDKEHCNRLLAGERNFLYHCFLLHCKQKLSEQEISLLYLYLVIKSNFRSEIIQNNKRVGFANFSNYQDRKADFWEEQDEYAVEAQRLSVGIAFDDNNVISLEARIMPKEKTEKIVESIKKLKRLQKPLCLNERAENLQYTIHFRKIKYKKSEFYNDKDLMLQEVVPRNHETRQIVKNCSRALAEYLNEYNVEDSHIVGIDACSNEIGCRPETFATEFRYLKECIYRDSREWWKKPLKTTQLGVTYHVGEDYIDIVDGLRAIDEAVSYLHLGQGDRLGHAIALGIEVSEYYAEKRNRIFLFKQDYLDNLIWILYRSLELNVTIETHHRAKMMEEARSLFGEIYSKFQCNGKSLSGYCGEILDEYFKSWKLRGEHPDLYKSGRFVEQKQFFQKEYDFYMKDSNVNTGYRKNDVIMALYYAYHFDADVKIKGLEAISYKAEDWYIDIVQKMQKKLQYEVSKKKISVECNPTSNVLISTFRRYDKHPILSFNDYRLGDEPDNPRIQVSINTDDIGVFDTSLENEYDLLFSALRRMRHKQGIYKDQEIYDYLEYLRQNGLRMAFKNYYS